MRSIFVTASVLLLVLGSGCADDSEPSDAPLIGDNGQPLPEGSVDCSNDARLVGGVGADTNGERGVLSFRLSQLEPSPPAKGNNTFHLEVIDSAGSPVEKDLRVDLRMPDHGHGTSVKPRISFDPTTEQYTVTPLYLFMPGVWRIQLEAYDPGAAAPVDRTALFFCIPG
jgi:hypothetical protein